MAESNQNTTHCSLGAPARRGDRSSPTCVGACLFFARWLHLAERFDFHCQRTVVFLEPVCMVRCLQQPPATGHPTSRSHHASTQRERTREHLHPAHANCTKQPRPATQPARVSSTTRPASPHINLNLETDEANRRDTNNKQTNKQTHIRTYVRTAVHTSFVSVVGIWCCPSLSGAIGEWQFSSLVAFSSPIACQNDAVSTSLTKAAKLG
jgi:hypothetical protein